MSPLSRGCGFGTGIVLGVLLLAGTAAGADDEAQTASKQGDALRKKEHLLEAATAYERSVAAANRLYSANDQRTGNLLNALGETYQRLARYDDAETTLQRGLKIREAAPGNSQLRQVSSLLNLASLSIERNDYARAESLYQRALKIVESERGAESRDMANCVTHLGNLYHTLAQYDKAETFLQRGLHIREKVAGKDSIDVAASAQALGGLARTLGQYDRAEPLFRRALAIRESKQGQDHIDVAGALIGLGALYNWMGLYEKAEPLLKRAVEIDEAKLGKDHLFVASAVDELALVQRNRGELQQAEASHQRSLHIRRERLPKDHPLIAVCYHNLALLQQVGGHFAQAESYYQAALRLREEKFGKEHLTVASTLAGLGNVYRSEGEFARAEPLYRRSLRLYQNRLGANHPDVARSLGDLGITCLELSRYTEAQPLCERSLKIREAKFGADHPDVAFALSNLATLHRLQGHFDQVEPLLERSLKIREGKFGKESLSAATAWNDLAIHYRVIGQYTRAESLYRHTLEVREAHLGKDHLEVANSLNNLANLYVTLGRYEEAETMHQRGLKIRQAKLGKDHPLVAQSLTNLAYLYASMGEDALVEPLMLRSLHINETHYGKDHLTVAQNLSDLGGVHLGRGEYDKAGPLLERSLQIREAKLGKDHPDVAAALFMVARLRIWKKKYAEAEPLLQRCLKIYEEHLDPDHPSIANTLVELAGDYRVLGQNDKAVALHLRALKIREAKFGPDHPAVAVSQNNLGYLYLSLGELEKVEPLFQRSLKTRKARLGPTHPLVAQTLANLGDLYATEQLWDRAAEMFDESRHIHRIYVNQLLPGLSEEEQLSFLSHRENGSLQQALSVALKRPNDTGLAARSAEWVLNGKAVAQQALADRTLLTRDSKDPHLTALIKQLLEVRTDLASLSLKSSEGANDAQRRQRLAQLTEREQELSKRLGQVAPSRSADPWVELAPVRRAVPNGAVLVELFKVIPFDFQATGKVDRWQTKRYVAWVIPPDGKGQVQVVDLGQAKVIEDAVAVARKALRDSPRQIRQQGEPESEQALRKPLEALTALVLQPLAKHLDPAKQWIISPDGALWLVPWSVLPLANGKYAIEEHQISYVVTGRDLLQQAAAPTGRAGRPVVLADPDFNLGAAVNATRGTESLSLLGSFPRLPGTAAEAAAVVPELARFAHEKPLLFTGREASKARFRSVLRPKVLVVSTHAFFLDEHEEALGEPGSRQSNLLQSKALKNPLLRCGLVLAGANREGTARGEGGLLTGLEIIDTDLRGTELVVLSACETGLGQVHSGEGVSGLRQAFQLAGAESVVASLWQVPDVETAQLMTRFFERLAAGKGKVDALREAQLALIQVRRAKNNAAHPLFWAAFTLTGKW